MVTGPCHELVTKRRLGSVDDVQCLLRRGVYLPASAVRHELTRSLYILSVSVALIHLSTPAEDNPWNDRIERVDPSSLLAAAKIETETTLIRLKRRTLTLISSKSRFRELKTKFYVQNLFPNFNYATAL